MTSKSAVQEWKSTANQPASQERGGGQGQTEKKRTSRIDQHRYTSPLTRRQKRSRSWEVGDEKDVNVDADVPLQANLMKINLFRVRLRVRARASIVVCSGSGSGFGFKL